MNTRATPLISIIMPTLNSEATISLSLKSIRSQNLSDDLYEIIVVDGGSTDDTVKIAKAFDCRVLHNPKVLPEHAKLVGLAAAAGRYAMLLDSDEALCKKTSLQDKLHLLETFRDVGNVVTAGSIVPKEYGGISDYANRFGDPFSYFIYRIDGSDYWNGLLNNYHTEVREKVLIATFVHSDILPICDAGAHFFDLGYLKSIADINDIRTVPIIFPVMASHTKKLAVISDDYTIHYSKQNWSSFKNKLRWRVISNVHRATGAEGYRSRESFHPRWIYFKTILFVLYGTSIVLPIYDAIRLAVSYRKLGFLVHFPATIYTLAALAKQTIRRIFSKPGHLPTYGDR